MIRDQVELTIIAPEKLMLKNKMFLSKKISGHTRPPRGHLNGREPLGWRLAGLWQAGHAHQILSRGTAKRYGQEVRLRGTVKRYSYRYG